MYSTLIYIMLCNQYVIQLSCALLFTKVLPWTTTSLILVNIIVCFKRQRHSISNPFVIPHDTIKSPGENHPMFMNGSECCFLFVTALNFHLTCLLSGIPNKYALKPTVVDTWFSYFRCFSIMFSSLVIINFNHHQ